MRPRSRRIGNGLRWIPPALLGLAFLILPGRAPRGAALAGIGVYALSYVYSALASRSLTVKRADAILRCFRNEPFAVTLRIENASRFPFAGVLVADLTGPLRAEGDGRILASFPGRSRASLSYSALAPERGEFRVGPAELRISDPLGLFPRSIVFPETSALIVYPETRRIGGSRPSGVPQGALRVADRAYEDVTRFRSIRPYLPGDELRRINWKASARSRSLVTNEYLSSLTSPLMIALDLDESGYARRSRYDDLERAVETAASLVRAASGQGQPVGFATNGRFWGGIAAPPMPPAPGNGTAIMDALARVGSFSGPDGADAASIALSIQLPGRCRLAYVGPFPGQRSRSLLLRARERGFAVELRAVGRGEGPREPAAARFFQVFEA